MSLYPSVFALPSFTLFCPRARKDGPLFFYPIQQTNVGSREEFTDLDFFEDVAAVEAAEASIDQFIERRARQNDEANRLEAAWTESTRRHNAQRREANRQRWIDYFEHMHRLHLSIAAEHADRRSRLMLEGGYEPGEGAA